MQRAKTTLKLSILATLLVHGGFAVAQVAIPTGPIGSISLAAPSVPDSKPAAGPVGAAAKALSIGRADEASAAAGSLKELENLQREAFLGELRAKIRAQSAGNRGESQPAATGAAPAAGLSPVATTSLAQVVPSGFAPPRMAPTMFPIFQQPGVGLDVPGAPTAQLVSVIVSAARTRADVMEDGVVKTVKEGDKLGDWSVTSIKTNGVMVERTVPLMQQVQPARPPAVYKANGVTKTAPNKAMQFVVPTVPYERVTSVMLKPYHPPAAAPAVPGQAGIVAPIIPPLPASIKVADSTSIAPAVSLAVAK